MSVLIKGMKKPEKCEDCRCICSCGNGWRCGLVITNGRRRHGYSFEELHDACPLVEVPTPHGRLIDADALKKAVFHHLSIKGEEHLLLAEKSVFGNIIKAPTVIEAEVKK